MKVVANVAWTGDSTLNPNIYDDQNRGNGRVFFREPKNERWYIYNMNSQLINHADITVIDMHS